MAAGYRLAGAGTIFMSAEITNALRRRRCREAVAYRKPGGMLDRLFHTLRAKIIAESGEIAPTKTHVH